MSDKEIEKKEIKNSRIQQMEKLLKKYNNLEDYKQGKIVYYVRIYGFAISIGIAGIFSQYYLNQFLSKTNHIFLLFFPIALSAWYGGFWAGIITLLISAAGADY